MLIRDALEAIVRSNSAVIARTNTWFVTRQHEISVIAGATNTKTQTVRVGRLPTGLAANTSTGRLYVANVPRKGTSTIAVFAPGGSAPIRTYPLTEEFAALAVPR